MVVERQNTWKGRCSASWLKIFHRKMLSVKITTYIRSMRIQCCYNFILFNIQFFKTVFLCCWIEIGFFCHNKSSSVIFGSVHLLCKWLNRLLWISTKYDILCKSTIDFWNQFLFISPNSFRKVFPIYCPWFRKNFFDFWLIQCYNIPTYSEPFLKFIGSMIDNIPF